MIALASSVGIDISAAANILDCELDDFGEGMLMVAYESIAYGSLLRIVAYEVAMFHVPNTIRHEKLQRRFRRSYNEKS